MPVIVELRLHPERRIEPTTRQLHGLACALFESRGPGHGEQEKPFTAWPLRAVSGGWLLRGAWLPTGLPQGVLTSLGSVRLGSANCAVTDVTFHPVTHEELASGPPADGARLTLLSPVYFSQNGAYVTEPDPRLMVGSWRRRWNASLAAGHPLRVDGDLWRDIHLALHVTGSGLRTEPRDTGYRQQDGLVGTMTLRLETGADVVVRAAFGALARFAEYCGTGAQVTHGFGATKTTLLQSSWSAAANAVSASDHGEILR
jgi:CRISPR-associated endoribonuclease Cas6